MMKRIVLVVAMMWSAVSVADVGGQPVIGTALHLVPQASSPPAACRTTGALCLWYDNSATAFKLRLANGTDQTVGAGGGGGGGTLQSDYTAGGAGGGVIPLTASGGGLQIKDNATPIGGNLLSVTDSTGATTYFAVTASSAGTTSINLNNGSSASLSSAGTGTIIYNNLTHTLQASVNGGAYADIGAGGGGGGGGGGSGTVTSVATDATLTGGPITTTGTIGINLSNDNSWGGVQTFTSTPVVNNLHLNGSVNAYGGAGQGLLSAYSSANGFSFTPGAVAAILGPLVIANYVTGSRPSASGAGAGAMIYDTSLSLPLWSDGTNWKDAAGTVR